LQAAAQLRSRATPDPEHEPPSLRHLWPINRYSTYWHQRILRL